MCPLSSTNLTPVLNSNITITSDSVNVPQEPLLFYQNIVNSSTLDTYSDLNAELGDLIMKINIPGNPKRGTGCTIIKNKDY